MDRQKEIFGYIAFEGRVPRYVGIGLQNRWKHVNSSSSHNKELRSYHKQNIKLTLQINNHQSWESAVQWEKSTIKFYGRKDRRTGSLFNHTDGGDGNSEGGAWMLGLTKQQITKNLNWINPSKNALRPTISIIQQGVTMRERLGDLSWKNPKRGRKMQYYKGVNYLSPMKGISRHRQNEKIHCQPITLQNTLTNEVKTWQSHKQCKQETGVNCYILLHTSCCKQSKGWKLHQNISYQT